MEKVKYNLDRNKVLLGLSGGVDSTSAALLLKEKGYDVTGYYFDITGSNVPGQIEAQKAADQADIPLITEDVSALFENVVVSNFCQEYRKGRTPNPCIICNPNVKFRRLLAVADEIGAYHIATGHYAQIFHDSKQDKYYVKQAANLKKDQSYMLYRLEQDVLCRLLFPLGEFENKEEVRNLARSQNLFNADKKDSQEICFVPGDDYTSYLEQRGCISPPGDFVNAEGNILGRHKGIIHYTVGQRKGLGIALGRPVFVTRIDAEKNVVVLGENQDLFCHTVVSSQNIFAAGNDSAREYDGARIMAKVRYSAKPASAVLRIREDGCCETVFEEAQRAATPGQSIVWYADDHVIGGGFICRSLH
ncbi:MAG: tRNA 2-thiouridine(34) synthase MnmA [Firmicutes bacterium]|nr:tRNA 2-thiouridine(34) synthase MnmA [Bacillota bacterium]